MTGEQDAQLDYDLRMKARIDALEKEFRRKIRRLQVELGRTKKDLLQCRRELGVY